MRTLLRLPAVLALAALAVTSAHPAATPGVRRGAHAAAPAGVAFSAPPRSAALAARPAGPAPAAKTARPRVVDVVRVLPRGARPDPAMTPQALTRVVGAASAYWGEQTGGAVTFTVKSVSPWTSSRLPCSDVYGMWREALKVVPAAAGARRHLVVAVPSAVGAQPGCLFGFGSMGAGDSGGSTYITALSSSLLAHELGHNLGLGHANALTCDGAQDGRWTGDAWPAACEDRAYDDLFDVMGYSGDGFGDGNVNAVHLDQLVGLVGLDPTVVRTVGAGTTRVRIPPMSRLSAPGRVLKVAIPGEPAYYAEYRTASGRDAAAARGAWRPQTGVRILRADPRYLDATGSYELDASPGRGWQYDRALPVGQTFTSAGGRVRIRVVATDAVGATLEVSAGARVAAAAPAVAARTRALPHAVSMTAPARGSTSRRLVAATRVRAASGAPVPGWTVVLQHRTVGGTAWRDVVVTRTSATGEARASLSRPRPGAYRWLTRVAPAAPARSSRVAVIPAPG